MTLSLRRLSCIPSSHRAFTVAIPCWPGRQEPSPTGYNVCWMPQPVSSVILGSSTEAWHICSTSSCTGLMFRSESCISSEWQFTGVSKARLPSTSWTAAAPHRTLPVVSDLDLPAAMHHLVIPRHRRSTFGRLAFSVAGPMAWNALPDDLRDPSLSQEDAKDASVSHCTWTLCEIEALRNALYKFKTYLLTYLLTYLDICPKIIYLSKKSRLGRRKCRNTTRAPDNVN